MSMELKMKIVEMLEKISADLQAKCEDNKILKSEIKDYLDNKIYNVRYYGLQYVIDDK